MDLSYILNHLGEDRENYYGAVSPAIVQSSNFSFRDVAHLRTALKQEFETPFYTRGYNPTVGILRKKIAALEGAEDALVFSSGSAAAAAAVMSVVKAGDHVICVQKPYSWTNKLLNQYLARYGVETSMIDGNEIENFKNAIKPNTKLIFLESPNSMTFEMQDIKAVVALAKNKNIVTIIDNSYSSPLFQSPMALGVDMIVHSATKYLNGHSDVVAGVVCASKKRIEKLLEEEYMTIGSIISAHDAWLLLRGLRTLELRVNRSYENAKTIIPFLEQHPKIEKVFYPFSKEQTQQNLATTQMKGAGGLFSVLIKAERVEQVEVFCNSLQRFLIACSWGGYESLVFPMCALHSSISYDNPLSWKLVRIYLGIEDASILMEDLKNALEKV